MVKTFEEMTREDLQQLRNEIVLNSIYFYDYANSFGFNVHDICAFFDGYYSYLEELVEEDGKECTTDNVIEYDTIDNLECWFNCYDDLSWVRIDDEDDEDIY